MKGTTTASRASGEAIPLGFAFVLALIPFLLGAVNLHAQSVPGVSAYQFSSGVHPTLDATFENASESEVTTFWRNELKSISAKVTNKKELIGATARIPSASADTIRIFIAVEKPKGALFATAHIAFLTTSGFVGPDSPERELTGCTEWVQQRTVILRRQLAQAELDRATRVLENLTRQLDMLKRENQRAENGILKAQQRGEQAERDKQELEGQLKGLAEPVREAGIDSTEQAQLEKDRLRDQRKMVSRVTRAVKTSQAMEKKVEDLQWAIKKNEEDQVAKQNEVDRQQQVVNDLQEKLRNIR
ncbi:MAG: hypothetical protein K8H89_07380 [Flavobacteriales bacterium]|jgi:hypothetical protein|nr:hypothetical protein [Flavobacteriales bacterium]MCB0757441.1 hypothetical protein [Flavobacteriales bacterium]